MDRGHACSLRQRFRFLKRRPVARRRIAMPHTKYLAILVCSLFLASAARAADPVTLDGTSWLGVAELKGKLPGGNWAAGLADITLKKLTEWGRRTRRRRVPDRRERRRGGVRGGGRLQRGRQGPPGPDARQRGTPRRAEGPDDPRLRGLPDARLPMRRARPAHLPRRPQQAQDQAQGERRGRRHPRLRREDPLEITDGIDSVRLSVALKTSPVAVLEP